MSDSLTYYKGALCLDDFTNLVNIAGLRWAWLSDRVQQIRYIQCSLDLLCSMYNGFMGT